MTFAAADLIPANRWDDFASALLSSRTRELVRSRTSATKSREIKQLRKAAELLDSSRFQRPPYLNSSTETSGASSPGTSVTSGHDTTQQLSTNESAGGHLTISSVLHSSAQDGVRTRILHARNERSNFSSTPLLHETSASIGHDNRVSGRMLEAQAQGSPTFVEHKEVSDKSG